MTKKDEKDEKESFGTFAEPADPHVAPAKKDATDPNAAPDPANAEGDADKDKDKPLDEGRPGGEYKVSGRKVNAKGEPI